MIRQITDREVVDIYSARKAVECYALGLLCLKDDPGLADRLSRIIEREEKQPRHTITDYFEANKMIHRTFVEETGNSFLLDMFDLVWNRSIGISLFSEIGTRDLSLSLKDHLVLCDAVREGSVKGAEAAMRSHIDEGLKLQRQAMKFRKTSTPSSNVTEFTE